MHFVLTYNFLYCRKFPKTPTPNQQRDTFRSLSTRTTPANSPDRAGQKAQSYTPHLVASSAIISGATVNTLQKNRHYVFPMQCLLQVTLGVAGAGEDEVAGEAAPTGVTDIMCELIRLRFVSGFLAVVGLRYKSMHGWILLVVSHICKTCETILLQNFVPKEGFLQLKIKHID